MKFRKITAALTATLILGTTLILGGCGSSDSATGDELQKIKDAGVLKVGVKVDVPKFGYKDAATGNVEGLEVDIARQIAKKIFGDESKIETQAVTAKTRGPLLDNGEIDIVAATFTVTEERKNTYNFSDPYFKDHVALLVKKANGIKSLKDLNGKTIGVSQSSTTKDLLLAAATEQGVTLNFSEFSTYPEIKAALDSGRIDCFSVDGAILNGYLDDSTVILDEKFNPQEYGIASKKSNTALADLINEVIKEMKASGELDKLVKKWGIK